MEIINSKKREKRARLGTKMRYFKIPLCRIFTETSEIDQVKLRMNVGSNDTCQRHLRSKIGV